MLNKFRLITGLLASHVFEYEHVLLFTSEYSLISLLISYFTHGLFEVQFFISKLVRIFSYLLHIDY